MKISTVELQPYVPHRPPMIWVDEITDVNDAGGIGHTLIKAKELYLTDNIVRPSAYIEFIAQTYAFVQSIRARNAGIRELHQRALLVAIKDFSIQPHTPISVGTMVRTEVTKGREMGPITIIHGKVFSGDDLLALGEVKVFTADIISS